MGTGASHQKLLALRKHGFPKSDYTFNRTKEFGGTIDVVDSAGKVVKQLYPSEVLTWLLQNGHMK